MNYQKIHDEIIFRAKNRMLTGYKERHHIIPRCIGGTDDRDNLVDLTAREHFIIHKLLSEIYPDTDKLIYAVWMMSNIRYDNRTYRIGSREYDRIRKLFKDKLSIKMAGDNNPFYGKEHTTEAKQKMSIAQKNRKPISEETRKKMSIAQKNRKRLPFTDEAKQKMSLAKQGYVMSEETKQKLRIISTGRKLSNETREKMKKPKKIIQCPHCLKHGGEPQMYQWHFNNCKHAKTK
jgi:hypothetical protein